MPSWIEKYYGFLKGAKIVEAGIINERGEQWPYFIIEKGGKRHQIEVSSDPEGNGPGHLAGIPRPQ